MGEVEERVLTLKGIGGSPAARPLCFATPAPQDAKTWKSSASVTFATNGKTMRTL